MRWSAWASRPSAPATSAICRRAVRAACSSGSDRLPAGDAQDLDPHQQHESHSRMSPPRSSRELGRRGVEVAQDGMEIVAVSARCPGAGRSSRRSCASRARAYHIHHPFNVLLNSGKANREQIRGWVANRYYYQISIPIKDAAILVELPGPRGAPQLGAAHSRPRRLRRGSRRDRFLAAARRRRWGCRASRWRAVPRCCRACASRSMPMSISRAARRGRRRSAPR